MALDSRLVFVAHLEDPPGTGLAACTGEEIPSEAGLPPGSPRQACAGCLLRESPRFAPTTPSALAQAAYAAYGESTGGKNYRGEPMPDWGGLGTPIQRAWVAAALAVQRALTPDEAPF